MAKKKRKSSINYHDPTTPPPNANVGDPTTGKLEYREIKIGDLCILIVPQTGTVFIMMVNEVRDDGISIVGSSKFPYEGIISQEHMVDGRYVRFVFAQDLIPSYIELVGKQFCDYDTFSHQIELYDKNNSTAFIRN